MAVQTGTTYTFRRQVTFDYTCSKCGAQCAGSDTLEKEVFTSALIRVDPRREADDHFCRKITELNKGPVPERYSDTSLFCTCKNCHHMEPWAESLPKRVSPHLLWFVAVTMIVAVGVPAIPAGLPRFLCLASGTIPYFALVIRNAVRRGKRLKAIRALPAQSLPVIH